MPKVTLFIAMSLDGYVAKTDGSVDWLGGNSPEDDDMTSYNAFIQNIDTVVMGYDTYEQITTDLSPNSWLYNGQTTYVLTHRSLIDTPNIHFVNRNVGALVRDLKQKPGVGIWICGGPSIVAPLIQDNLIDTYHLSIIPHLLGSGIPLFKSNTASLKLSLIKTESYNGIVDVVYERRAKN